MTEDNSTEQSEDTTDTKIVRGAPVKITRARGGSQGKDTRVELIPKPDDDNWLDIELLNEPSTLHNTPTGYDRWVERTGRSLEKIEGTVVIENLAEALSHEDPLVQETANKKLRELRVEQIKLVLDNERVVAEKIQLLRSLTQSDRLTEEEKQLLKLELQGELLQELEALEAAENLKASSERKKRFDTLDMSEEVKK